MTATDRGTPFERDLSRRLRDLATHARDSPTGPAPTGVVGPTDRPARRPRPDRRAGLLAAAAAIVVIGGGTVWLARAGDGVEVDSVTAAGSADGADDGAAAPAPDGFGRWTAMADAPIAARPHAATAWTGTEVVYWAGSNLNRSFAHSDGAAYEPATDTWRTITTPGWGHPGLSGTFFDGELFVVAKGGGSRFDPVAGTWSELAEIDGLILASAVATDEAVYGIGPLSFDDRGSLDVGIARYDPASDRWGDPVAYSGPALDPDLFTYGFLVEQPAIWTGSEIVVWQDSGAGLAFDPDRGAWRVLPPLWTGDGTREGTGGRFSVAAAVDGQLVALANPLDEAAAEATPERAARVARLSGDGWRWSDDPIPVTVDDTITVTPAGDWLVVLSPEAGPITYHVPSGRWQRHADGPAVQAPNAAWTGDRLVVWGGVTPDGAGRRSEAGMIWSPLEDD